MLEILTLTTLSETQYVRLVADSGYTSTEKYAVSKQESDERLLIALELVVLDKPYIKRWGYDDELEDEVYPKALAQGLSLGAYLDGELVGLALTEKRAWNETLWLWEFHVAEVQRGQGIGRRLMEALEQRARAAGLRMLALETQNTNIPAIRFYRALGFEIEGIDLSLYSNEDVESGEVALF
ncbi:MAG: GNAT family N-acetyltransferase, partial [Anaerolineales bacterium]|nr:GNAT family N-acetyltransferase [Anaerolineales bacterium]